VNASNVYTIKEDAQKDADENYKKELVSQKKIYDQVDIDEVNIPGGDQQEMKVFVIRKKTSRD